MTVEEALRLYLLQDTDLLAVVGVRISPEGSRDDKVFPYVVYQILTEEDMGAVDGCTGFPTATLLLECYGYGTAGYGDARQVAGLIAASRGGTPTNPKLADWSFGWWPAVDAEEKLYVTGVRVVETHGGEPEEPAGGEPRLVHKIVLQVEMTYKATEEE